MGHILMENRKGLIVDVEITHASGTAEREAALAMLGRDPTGTDAPQWGPTRATTARPSSSCRKLKVTPHVAAKDKHSAVDGRIERHEGYQTSQHRWLVGRASCVSAGIGAPERGKMASKRALEAAEIAAQLLLSRHRRRNQGMRRV